ncbi:ATP-binding protein [Janthinobacterium sp. 17J80-10]|uniref:ATP-binding protein n=1 Tax=Janthinobacterium sp. 17J80-10 TaxID=2497863 RepID=UPI0013E8B2F2|nr:ATP-binding protein [Janthinobacterium sp. 17J80-10]
MRTQAQVVGQTSIAALSFNDVQAATEYLAALKAKPSIAAGALYRPDGKLFASYTKAGSPATLPKMQSPGYRIHGGEVELYHLILQPKSSEAAGTVYLRADLQQITRTIRYGGIVFLVMLVSLCAGWWISTRQQQLISTPILEIASVAQAVIDRKDYSLRAAKYSNDEIGSLTDAFNQMLAHIQERDARLIAFNESLQKEIEERKQTQLALKHNMQELARSNAELEQFAYVSSHDLQEPLRMVASYTQLLEKRYSDKFDEKGLLFMHYIVDGAKRMQQLIDDLLMFSRVGTRGKELQPIAIESVLRTALLNLRPAIQESGAKISHDPFPVVMGDATQLTQVFQNLLSNAIKFCGKNIPLVHIGVTKKDNYWQFAIEDNGIGIEPEHFDRIFVIFQRLHGRTDYPGSGIGLAICKKIVDRHGGHIWVESHPAQGATFYFTLKEAL